MSTLYPTIGLEIHAELKTETKMFSRAVNNPDEETPNTNINPVDLAHPGTLPTINQQALEHMIRIGLAIDGTIADYTEFDRKNYFYPDIPKGYQISQYAYPIVSGGTLCGVPITRIHLEEDTGNSKHDQGAYTLVDYNRAGIPLMELVTEPNISSAKQAGDFARELQLLLRYLGVADAHMEKGEMRVEANISVSEEANELGTKVEVKNLNSFKSVERAIAFEIERMEALIEAGKKEEIVQETRGWDEHKQVTFSQRSKESAHDYRYFPDPDLPKLYLHSLFSIDTLRASLPELPAEKRIRYQDAYNLPDDITEIFIFDQSLGDFFERTAAHLTDTETITRAAHYISSDILGLRQQQESFTLPEPAHFATLLEMNSNEEINSRATKDLLAVLVDPEITGDPRAIAEERDILQLSDTETLQPIIEEVCNEHQEVTEQIRNGKTESIKFLIGQVMKKTRGRANPRVVEDIITTITS